MTTPRRYAPASRLPILVCQLGRPMTGLSTAVVWSKLRDENGRSLICTEVLSRPAIWREFLLAAGVWVVRGGPNYGSEVCSLAKKFMVGVKRMCGSGLRRWASRCARFQGPNRASTLVHLSRMDGVRQWGSGRRVRSRITGRAPSETQPASIA